MKQKLLSGFFALLVFFYIAAGPQTRAEYLALFQQFAHLAPADIAIDAPQASTTSDNALVAAAFKARAGNIQAEITGTVVRVLADDSDGSRHQRFIVLMSNGQTILVAHNIDLAPRVTNISTGDAVSLFGEYEWSEQGGVIHWTHHDPAGRHKSGWIRHGGFIYQ